MARGERRRSGRRDRRRLLGALGAVSLAAAALAAGACARSADSPPPLLRVGLHGDPLVLDPHLRNEALTFSVLRNVFEALTAFDPHMRVGPALAATWENPDDLTWIFHLRPGVRFHDGRALDAADVVASLERARRHPRSNFASYLVAVRGVRALGAAAVEITTDRPYPILLNKLAFVLIVPADAPEEIRQPVGTGPYRVLDYRPGERLLLERFGGYWAGVAPEARVEMLPLADRGERLRRLVAGELDLVQEPGPESAAACPGGGGCRLLAHDGLSVAYLLLDRRRPPFADRRVRQAVDLALDRARLVEQALGGHGAPAGQMVSRNVFGYAPGVEPPARDLARARALLAEAGYPRGLDLELEFRDSRDAGAIVAQLAEAGIRARPHPSPWAELYPRLLRGEVAFYHGAVLTPAADASDLFDSMVHTPDPARGYGDSNFTRYSNPELDALIEEGAASLRMLGRRQVLERCLRLLAQDLVFVPLWVPASLFAVGPDIDWHPRLDGWILAAEVRRRPHG